MPTTHIVKRKTYKAPPGLNSLTQRICRFRAKTGCLSWDSKLGTDKRNQYILGCIPDHCKVPEENSTRSLNYDPDETMRSGLSKVNKGKCPQKKRKKNRGPEDVNKEEEEDESLLSEPSPVVSKPREAGESSAVKASPKVIGKAFVAPMVPKSVEARKSSAMKSSTRALAKAPTSPTIPVRHTSRNIRKRSYQQYAEDSDSEGEPQSPEPSNETCGAAQPKRSNPHRKARVKPEDTQPIGPSISNMTDDVAHPQRSEKVQKGGKFRADTLSTIRPKLSSIKSQVPTPGAAAQLQKYVLEPFVEAMPKYNEEFQLETDEALGKKRADYRYMTPFGKDTDALDRAQVRRALELTCIDFCNLTGRIVPRDLLNDHHCESYESQHRHIQQELRRVWCGEKLPELYRLPFWTGGFHCWKVGTSFKGQQLLNILQDEERPAE